MDSFSDDSMNQTTVETLATQNLVFENLLRTLHNKKSFNPRHIKIFHLLISSIIILMILFGSFNYFLSYNRQQLMNREIQVIQNLQERINWTAKSRVAFRALLNMMNGYEPKSSELFPQRFEKY